MKPTLPQIEKRLEVLENRAATDAAIETPTGFMFVPFGTEVSDEWAGTLEAEERIRQGKPVGFISVPYKARPFYNGDAPAPV